jgi:cyclic pyranopterin phosphate synthase
MRPSTPSESRGAARSSAARELSHVELSERSGRARSRMVDVSAKPIRARSATARARVVFPAGLLSIVLRERGPKGPVEEMSRAAGLMAAKRTSELIPMCHPLGLDHLEIRFEAVAADVLEVRCKAACRGRTGVEMEALVGSAVAALTVYDMTKAMDHGIRITDVELLEKSGGRSGVWRRDAQLGSRPSKRKPSARHAARRTVSRASRAR